MTYREYKNGCMKIVKERGTYVKAHRLKKAVTGRVIDWSETGEHVYLTLSTSTGQHTVHIQECVSYIKEDGTEHPWPRYKNQGQLKLL